MKGRSRILLGVILTSSACAFAQPAIPRDSVPVYDSTEIAFDRYTVIKRLWVDSWKSAMWIRGYRDEPSAKRALLDEAKALGADAVVNLYCLGQTDAVLKPRGYYCYGNAVRLKK
jgi:hypothetical protein